MFRSSHCLHTLLPDLKVTDIVLRNSGTSFNRCSYKLYKQSFVKRCLFCDCYWYVLFCGTYTLFDLIWCIIFSPHKWMAFVHLNKRHVMLYVMLCFIFHTQGGSVLYVGTKFEADSSIRSKVIRGSQISPRPQTPSWGCGTAKMAGDVHYLFLQTQFGEDRCTQFRVIVITIYRQDQL